MAKNKKQIMSIELKSQTAPTISEKMGSDWIEYSGEDWHNAYPNFLVDLYYSSSTHAAIINTTADIIGGEDIIIEETDNLEAQVKLSKFFKNANSDETLHEVVKKCAFDFKLQGGYFLNIIWSKDRQTISEIRHVSAERVRVGKPNALGKTDTYYVSADWTNTRDNEPVPVPAFNINDRTNPSQLLYAGSYSPGMDAYYLPDYIASNNWSLIDSEIAQYHLANVQNNFSGTMVVSMNNGIPSERERLDIEKSLNNKFSGSANAGKVILTFSDGSDRSPEITPIQLPNSDKTYLALQELIQKNILTGHRCTSPLLVGIRDTGGGLGNNAQEMTEAFDLYLNSVVKGYQKNILKTLSKIFAVNDMDLPIQFVQAKPVSNKFTIEDMRAVMTTSEIREELGLPVLEESDETSKEELKKVGSMITDGIELPLYETIEEAEAEAERLGCKGTHQHTQDGTTYFMPCEDHDTIKDLNLEECNCKEELISPNPCQKGYEPIGHKTKGGKKEPNCVPIKASALEKFISLGEDLDDSEWELYSETDAEDEDNNFNFERELHDLTRIELASTGRAIPNAKSGQDQTSKQTNYQDDIYRVRYVYDGPGGERAFCKAMKAANKAYRKEDIIRMGTQAVNPGFGPGGSDTYSIWKYKGGKHCYHRWFRRVYITKKGERPSNLDEIISSTEARSRGVSLPRNAQEVSVAPINMPNKGAKN